MTGPAPRRIRGLAALPALRALLAQVLAFPLTLLATWLLARAGVLGGEGGATWFAVALLQGAWAALVSWRLRLASWWRAIGLLFPVAVLAASAGATAFDLPPALFLAVFVLLLLVYWSTFRTQVPYYPSGKGAWDLVAQQLPQDRPLDVIDIGSGLGGFVLDLARRRPDCRVSGIELAPLPWLASRLRALLANSRARFLRGDYEDLNFGHYDVVFAYLSPAAMGALWRKAEAEMRPGTMLLSYEFIIDDRPPDFSFVTTDSKKILHLWHF
ncbi:cyclopropane-fatty-acyl-phospholipid synthase family protein [uncultured Massilia sp.]|uniref:SAM-dependent methyltransferase n=1 Tax=uncultured Massilia sp. TaxID=169973 RepID=UPI0025EBDA23|nr:class I SAM-dependent methyltransferase [uncultured Massilia sp.]